MLEFGEITPGAVYIDRPGVYGIFAGPGDTFGLIKHVGDMAWSGRYAIPGGGIDPDESHEDALIREMREETGYDIHIRGYVGCAVQYTHGLLSKVPLRKICHFYVVSPVQKITDEIEADHALEWLPYDEAVTALETLSYAANVWAYKELKASGFLSSHTPNQATA